MDSSLQRELVIYQKKPLKVMILIFFDYISICMCVICILYILNSIVVDAFFRIFRDVDHERQWKERVRRTERGRWEKRVGKNEGDTMYTGRLTETMRRAVDHPRHPPLKILRHLARVAILRVLSLSFCLSPSLCLPSVFPWPVTQPIPFNPAPSSPLSSIATLLHFGWQPRQVRITMCHC